MTTDTAPLAPFPPEGTVTCPKCRGIGEWEQPEPFRDDPYHCRVIVCSECHGFGIIDGIPDQLDEWERDDD